MGREDKARKSKPNQNQARQGRHRDTDKQEQRSNKEIGCQSTSESRFKQTLCIRNPTWTQILPFPSLHHLSSIFMHSFSLLFLAFSSHSVSLFLALCVRLSIFSLLITTCSFQSLLVHRRKLHVRHSEMD